MPTQIIRSFEGGIDVRRDAASAPPTTLRDLVNGYINAGGEIEKRRAFPVTFTLASMNAVAPTIGLTGSFLPEVFGEPSAAILAAWQAAFPNQLGYRGVPDALVAEWLVDHDLFDNIPYFVGRRSDGVQFHRWGGVPTAAPNIEAIRTFRGKVYGVAQGTVWFSALNNPSDWGGLGSGSINVDTADLGFLNLKSLEVYYNNLALIGTRGTQIWAMDPDPARNQLVQSLPNLGSVVRHGAARFGDGDVLMLSESGIRSMRARDSSNTASQVDTGAPIDELILERLRRDRATIFSGRGISERIYARIEPSSGQFWLSWPLPAPSTSTEIFVLNAVPGGVSAWSRYVVPFVVDYMEPVAGQMWLRTSQGLHSFGGTDRNTYDDSICEAVTPFYFGSSPAAQKQWTGFDIGCTGTWTIDVCSDPLRPEAWERIATVTSSSYSQHHIAMNHYSTHLALRLRSVGTGPARVSTIYLHHTQGASE